MYAKIKHSKLSEHKLAQLINEWVFCTPARVCAKKIGVNKGTVNLWYGRIRQGILSLPAPGPFSEEVEVDESYFGKRKTGQYKTGTVQGQVPVFGLKERKSGLVVATVVPSTKGDYLIPLIQKYVKPGTIIYTDGFGAYYHLKKYGYRHRVVLHDYTFVAQGKVHTNGIESFWAYTKHLLNSRKGLPYNAYQKHVKEAQLRFNTFDNKKLRRVVRKMLLSLE